MKKLIIISAIIFSALTGYAEIQREGNTFKSDNGVASVYSGSETKYKWEDKEGKSYTIYITKNGASYIIRTSKKTGKEYKYYLPKEVQEQIKKELSLN